MSSVFQFSGIHTEVPTETQRQNETDGILFWRGYEFCRFVTVGQCGSFMPENSMFYEFLRFRGRYVLPAAILLSDGGAATAVCLEPPVAADEALATDFWRKEFAETAVPDDRSADPGSGRVGVAVADELPLAINDLDLAAENSEAIDSTNPDARSLSDWERAESIASGEATVPGGSGPSPVTIVLGIASIVIVAGAYMKS